MDNRQPLSLAYVFFKISLHRLKRLYVDFIISKVVNRNMWDMIGSCNVILFSWSLLDCKMELGIQLLHQNYTESMSNKKLSYCRDSIAPSAVITPFKVIQGH